MPNETVMGLSREEFQDFTRETLTIHARRLCAHDQEQRAEIERLKSELKNPVLPSGALNLEDFKSQLSVVADIGGQFTSEESNKAFLAIEAHDHALRADIARVTRFGTTRCNQLDDEIGELKSTMEFMTTPERLYELLYELLTAKDLVIAELRAENERLDAYYRGKTK